MKKRSRPTASVKLISSQTEETSGESIVEGEVHFKVFCTRCGPKGPRVYRNGFDTNHTEHPQLFLCTGCRESCYAHTSWVPSQIAKLMFELFVKELVEEKVRTKVLAKKYKVSPSLVSVLVNHCTESITQILQKIREGEKEIVPILSATGEELVIIWADETFFRINGPMRPSSGSLSKLIDF